METPALQRIDVPFPSAGALRLRIALGACRLRLAAGAGEPWLSGACSDPSGALPCKVEQEEGTVRLSQQVRASGVLGLLSGLPSVELALGRSRPFDLALESGASEVALDLGGVPLSRLAVKQGAGRLSCDFAEPNPEAMESLTVESGAAALELRNLGNAGFAEMTLQGGAAAYQLDFGGTLRRDARVAITTGVSMVRLHVPASTAARIAVEPAMGSLEVGDGFLKKEGAFWTEAAVAGRTPALSIAARVALGSLRISTG